MKLYPSALSYSQKVNLSTLAKDSVKTEIELFTECAVSQIFCPWLWLYKFGLQKIPFHHGNYTYEEYQ